MNTVTSSDGSVIAYDRYGQGPALVIVTGALGDRLAAVPLAAALAPHFTVFVYDRRGRGDSGDSPPYSVDREIEDLHAIIGAAGGAAFVFGHSSGAALALEAAVRGLPITRLALYEPPFIVDQSRPPLTEDYLPTLRALVAEGRRAEAVEYFWRIALLLPPPLIARMREMPMWPGLVKLAHTIAYDGEIMGDHMAGEPLPSEWGTRVRIPTLVIDGGASPESMRNAVAALAELLPNAVRRTLEGEGHGAPAEVVAPVLRSFFLA